MTWLPLLLAATAGSLPALSARGVTRQLLAIQDAALSGLVFNEELLFDNDAASKLKCARECLGAGGCVAFTFTEMTSTSSAGCRGHRSSMSSQYSNTMRAGTMLHYVSETSSWLSQTCGSDADCPAVNSKCFYNLCLCTPGYFYSHKQNLCTYTCTDSDLQTTFTKYPGGGIAYHNIDSAPDISLNDCLVWCRDYPSGVCRNVEYRSSPPACSLHYDTALAEPADWESGLPDWDFYQKDCA